MSRSTFSLCVIVVVFGTVVLADPPTVSVQQQAELVPNAGIFVRVVVNCGDDPPEGTIEVAARQGNLAGFNIDTVPATAGRQEVEVFIAGIFVPGEASASASLACGPFVQGLDLGATIKIS